MGLQWLAVLELLLAAALWGFGFVAAIWAMGEVGPFALTFLRFALAILVTSPWLFSARGRRDVKRMSKWALWPGFILAATLIIQTWGLKYTTAAKAGFI